MTEPEALYAVFFPGEYLRLMAALSGTSSVDWAKEILVPDLSFSGTQCAS